MSSITKETEVFIDVCEKGLLDLAKILIVNDKVEPSSNNNKALLSAIENHHIEIVDLLFNDPRVKLEPSEAGNIIAGVIERIKAADILSLILKCDKFDITYGENNAIRRVSHNGFLDMVKLLLNDSRVDPSAMSNYALRWSITRDHFEVAKLLLSDTRVSLISAISYIDNNPYSQFGDGAKLKKFRDEMTPEAGKLRTAIEGLKTMRDNLDKLIAELSK